MKIFLIGWFGAGNLGDEAILLSELMTIRNAARNVSFFILSFDPERTERLTRDIDEVEKVIGIGSRHRFFKSDFKGLIRTFKRTDIVIIGGGGIFQDIYNHYPIPFFTVMALTAKLFRKFLMLYAVGIGPVRTAFGKTLCRAAAYSADIISVRDHESKNLLNVLGVKKEIHVSSDPVFLLRPGNDVSVPRAEKREGKEVIPRVGICVQNLLFWSEGNKRILAAILDELVRKKNAHIIFIPFGSYRDGWLHKETPEPVDVLASREIAGLMNRPAVINSGEMDPRGMMSVIGQLDLLISMRFHGVVMGIAMGVPVIALTYREESKIYNLMKRINRDSDLFFVDNLDPGRILDRIENIFLTNDEHRQDLEVHAALLRKEAEKSVQLLSGRFYT